MIDINKKYKTRDGRAVRILCTDGKSLHYTVVALVTKPDGEEDSITYTKDGFFYGSKAPTDHDLVECTPYEDFKIDDKVLISIYGKTWDKRHFAGVDSCGRALFYPYGQTSYTCPQERAVSVNFCKKADENV